MLSEVLGTAETQSSVSLQGLFVDVIFSENVIPGVLVNKRDWFARWGGISGSIIEIIEAIIKFIEDIYIIDAYVARELIRILVVRR